MKICCPYCKADGLNLPMVASKQQTVENNEKKTYLYLKCNKCKYGEKYPTQ